MLRKLKYLLLKLSRAHATSHEIGYGAAIGAFISIFPTFGASTILVIFLYRFLKFNLLSAVAASMISNVVTAPFFLVLSYKIGVWIYKPGFTINLNNIDLKTWYKHLDDVGISVLIGGLILSVIVGILIYFLVKYLVVYYRRVRKIAPKTTNQIP